MSIKWYAKVEYVGDSSNGIVESSWIRDFDDCPVFDPLRIYRVFWSPMVDDSPETVLDRMPEIPILTEKEETKQLPGYYRANIFAVEDNLEKLEMSRTKKSTQRKSSAAKSKSSTSAKPIKGSQESKPSNKGAEVKKAAAVNANLGASKRSSSVFKGLDKQMKNNEETSSDESDSQSLASKQIKALKGITQKLKQSLVEKCKEVDDLQEKLANRDKELEKLRELNRGLQEKVIDMLSSRPMSCNSSRSSSISSRGGSCDRLLGLSAGQPLSRSSSASSTSLSSLVCSLPDQRSRKRKITPPNSPLLVSGKKTNTMCSPPSTPSTQHNGRLTPKIPLSQSSSADLDSSNPYDAPFNKSTSSAVSPLKQRNSLDSSGGTITNCSFVGDSYNKSFGTDEEEPQVTDKVVDKENAEKSPEQDDLIEFTPAFKVSKSTLETIEKRPLSSTEDGTYVKELAVAVFSHKVLYNSSLSERKYSKASSDGEVPKPRRKLDEDAVEEIRRRLEARVHKECNSKVTAKEIERFSKSKVHRYIYEKIKKMRKNPKLKFLEEDAGNSVSNDN